MFLQTRYSFRILFKYRAYTVISLLGLSIAIASFWFIANYVKNSHQYDAFQQKYNNIYRLTMEVSTAGSTDHYATTGKPPGRLLSEKYAGIDAYATLAFYSPVVRVNNEVFKETGFFSVNPETLDVFSFTFLRGDPKTGFTTPNSILISRFLAKKYFNTIDAIGRQITLDENEYTVNGVFEDWPENAHLDIKALTYSEGGATGFEAQDWFDLEQYTYVLLAPANDQSDLNNTLTQLTAQYVAPILEGSGIGVKFHSQALSELYFAPSLIDDVPKGNLMYIHALTFAGILVLLIAGLNYINLSLTRSTQRTKEIRLKKILGISRKQLIIQSTTESLVMTLLVLTISLLLVLVFNTLYFEYTGFHSFTITGNWLLLISMLLITFVFGLLGTSYSGAYLSFSSRLIHNEGKTVSLFKKLLLGIQFAIASAILIVTLTMEKQIDFMKNKDLGFSKDQVLIVDLPDHETSNTTFIQLREQLKNFTAVDNVSLIGGGALPGEDNGKDIFEVMVHGNKAERVFNLYRTDENYCGLLDIKFASGRNFDANRVSDQNNAVIINEALAKSLNWQHPLGKKIGYDNQQREVIGVVKNFHNKSLHNLIEPIVFMFNTRYATNLLVKTRSSDLSMIKAAWADFFPNIPFSHTYFDQFIDAMYTKENGLARLLSIFSIISLALCCMGLFAVFSLHILQTTKEMSIRKILGANAIQLLTSVTGSYVIIALIATGIAIPAAWFLINNWLDGFSYRIQLNPIIFMGSISLILLASLMTILYHVIKLCNADPVGALKYE